MDAAAARRLLDVDAGATPEALRRAFLRAALRSHPVRRAGIGAATLRGNGAAINFSKS